MCASGRRLKRPTPQVSAFLYLEIRDYSFFSARDALSDGPCVFTGDSSTARPGAAVVFLPFFTFLLSSRVRPCVSVVLPPAFTSSMARACVRLLPDLTTSSSAVRPGVVAVPFDVTVLSSTARPGLLASPCEVTLEFSSARPGRSGLPGALTLSSMVRPGLSYGPPAFTVLSASAEYAVSENNAATAALSNLDLPLNSFFMLVPLEGDDEHMPTRPE